MLRIHFVCAVLLCAAVATVVSAAPGGVPGPPAGKGQAGKGQAGKGIGPQVAALAKAGVHGPQLAARVKALQAAKGIGAVNGQGKGKL